MHNYTVLWPLACMGVGGLVTRILDASLCDALRDAVQIHACAEDRR